MIKVLLVGDSLQTINVAWRHFAYSEYAAKATTLVSGAIANITSETPPDVVVYYASDDSTQFFELYRNLREEEQFAKIPLVVLADAKMQRSLTGMFTFLSTEIVGISIDDKRLLEIVRKSMQKKKTR